tara:strand:+ start:113 stop:355 length:243 start_codon:yes stop_codon:yes gene_type:complete
MSWFGDIFNIVQKWSDDTMKSAVSMKNSDSHKTHKEEEKKPYLKGMTKKQLEEYGRTLGIELDRRHPKSKLIAQIKAAQK